METYRYPSLRTGTSQDLLSVVTRAAELAMRREKSAPLPRKSRAQRLWIEEPCVALGAAAAAAAEALPPDWILRRQDRLFAALSGRQYRFDPEVPALARARALAGVARERTGREPALLALVSHPPVLGEMAHLNIELMRHSLLALRSVRGRPCRPRLMVAVDPFALDTIPLYEEGFYAGVMGRYHLGLDRLSIGRNPLSARLLRRAAWPRLAHRLLALLGAGGEAGVVLAGGVPSTTRALYAAREWAIVRRRASRLPASEVLRRLRQSPAFRAFESSGDVAVRSPSLLLQAYVMAAVAGTLEDATAAAPASAEQGLLAPLAAAAAEDLLSALGAEGAARREALGDLAREIERRTPFRRRLFRVLAARVLKKGRPVLFVPVVHKDGPPLAIEEREAWLWTGWEGGKVLAQDGLGRSWSGSAEDFAVKIGQESFS